MYNHTLIPQFQMPFQASYPLYNQIYVGDIPASTQKDTVFDHFMKYGNIVDLKLGINKYAKKFAFISFDHPDAVELAMKNASNTIIDDSLVRVDTIKNTKQYPLEANIYFRNIPSEINNEQISRFFAQFGKVVSLKLVVNANKSFLGYGYVQFESKESADKCLKRENDLFYEKNQIAVSRFVPRGNRENIKNNLYLKNLPEKMSVEEISQKIEEVFGRFGQINSKLVSIDKKTNKPFAFVCFASNESAEEAKNQLAERSLFGDKDIPDDQKMVITWVLDKREMVEFQKQSMSNMTNVYTKNLKPTVTEEQLREKFSKYGEILSICIQKTIKPTISAFLCFKNSEDAKDAIAKAGHDKSILELYEESIVCTFRQSKEQRSDYLRVIRKSKLMKRAVSVNKPEVNINFGMPAQPVNYPLNYSMPFMMGPNMPNMYPQQYPPQIQPAPQNFQNNFLMNNMGIPPQQQINPNANRNMNINPEINMQQNRSMMDQNQIPRKNFNQGYGGNQQNMGGNMPPQRSQQPYRQQKRGGGYQKFPYGNRPNPMGNRNDRNNYGNRQVEAPLTRINQNNLPHQEPELPHSETNHLLKQSLEDFLKNDADYQRNFLGTLLYPSVLKKTDEDLAPKITGMLIDFESFSVSDILEFIESESALNAAILEAKQVILGGGKDNE